jgi:hypothetical protein
MSSDPVGFGGFGGSGRGELVGLVENGVLTCEADGINSKFSESLDDVLEKSVNV